MNKFAAVVIISSIALIGGIVFISTKASDTGPVQGEEVPDLGGQHIAVGQEHTPYNSSPPTSGPHYGDPQPAGIYNEELIDERVIHSLEHGGVWIAYKPDLPQAQIDNLKKTIRKNRSKVLLSPRAKNESPISLASWGRLLNLDSFDEQVVKSFIRSNRDHAPETLPL